LSRGFRIAVRYLKKRFFSLPNEERYSRAPQPRIAYIGLAINMSSLDKYAKIYVPEWLLKVNEAPVTYVPSLEPKVIDFNQYSRSIHPDALLDDFAKEEKEAELERPRVQDVVMDRLPPMAPEGYSRRFTKLLMVEYHARLQQLESARLFNVLLTPHNTGLTGPDGKAQTGLYTLEARSIREG
jgi:hypothetical protein